MPSKLASKQNHHSYRRRICQTRFVLLFVHRSNHCLIVQEPTGPNSTGEENCAADDPVHRMEATPRFKRSFKQPGSSPPTKQLVSKVRGDGGRVPQLTIVWGDREFFKIPLLKDPPVSPLKWGSSAVSLSEAGTEADDRLTAKSPAYWLEKLPLWRVMAGTIDKRFIYQADKCVKRLASSSGNKGDQLVDNLRKHLERLGMLKVLHTDNLFAESWEKIRVAFAELALAGCGLPTAVLFDLVRKRAADLLEACTSPSNHDDIAALLDCVLPYPQETSGKIVFDVEAPKLSPILPVVSVKMSTTPMHQTFISGFLCVQVSKATPASMPGLKELCAHVISIIELPDNVEPSQVVIEMTDELLTAMRAVQFLCSPVITKEIDMDVVADIVRLHEAAEKRQKRAP